MDALIIAAGFGSRLRDISDSKPMTPVAGVPLLELGVRQAKAAGCKLAVLSNELDLFYGASFRERLPLLQCFDVIIDATYTGILKPDRRAYEMCNQALGLQGKDCVFVDDQFRNVQGAIQVGWQVVQFDVTHPAESYQRALMLLGL